MRDSKARNKTPIVDSTEQVMKRQTVFMRFGGSQVKQLCHYIEITCCGGPAVLNGNKKIGSGYPQVAYDKPSLASTAHIFFIFVVSFTPTKTICKRREIEIDFQFRQLLYILD